MNYEMTDESSRMAVESVLQRGERLLWVGRPIPWRLALNGLPRAGFGLLWTAVVALMFVQAGGMSQKSSFSSGSFTSPLGIIQLVQGLFLLFGMATILSPVWEYLKATRKVYALTDQRAILLDRFPATAVRSYTLRDLRQVERRGTDDQGDVIFAQETRVERYRGRRTSSRVIPIGFLAIANPREVETLLLDLQRGR